MIQKSIRSLKVLALAFLSSVSILGCKAERIAMGLPYQPPAIPPGGVHIVIYRPTDDFTGSAVIPTIYLDGKSIGKLEPMGYLDAIVPAGPHVLFSRYIRVEDGLEHESRKMQDINASEGQNIYFIYSGWWDKLTPVVEADALPQLEKVRRSVNPD